MSLVAALKPGEQAKLKLTRENADTDLTVTIGRRPRVTKKE
jgi:hypothetical protein